MIELYGTLYVLTGLLHIVLLTGWSGYEGWLFYTRTGQIERLAIGLSMTGLMSGLFHIVAGYGVWRIGAFSHVGFALAVWSFIPAFVFLIFRVRALFGKTGDIVFRGQEAQTYNLFYFFGWMTSILLAGIGVGIAVAGPIELATLGPKLISALLYSFVGTVTFGSNTRTAQLYERSTLNGLLLPAIFTSCAANFLFLGTLLASALYVSNLLYNISSFAVLSAIAFLLLTSERKQKL